jgi:DNA-binding LytR/AlgR family response regulator
MDKIVIEHEQIIPVPIQVIESIESTDDKVKKYITDYYDKLTNRLKT